MNRRNRLERALDVLAAGFEQNEKMPCCTYRLIGSRYLVRLQDGTYTGASSKEEAQKTLLEVK